jgi:hypothetical protein
MLKPIKKYVSRLPGYHSFRKFLWYTSLRIKSPEKIFSDAFRTNRWGDAESISGPGSNLSVTRAIRQAIPELIADYEVHSILDIPCGDFNWMSRLDLAVDYTGADIVDEIVQENRRKYFRLDRKFIRLDMLRDVLPEADLLLCRDCLVHFSFAHIFQSLRNIRSSGCKYLLTTTFIDRKSNFDIPTGTWRPINLQTSPFNFPRPMRLVDEKYMGEGGNYADKSLGLWRISDLPPFA